VIDRLQFVWRLLAASRLSGTRGLLALLLARLIILRRLTRASLVGGLNLATVVPRDAVLVALVVLALT
jgi:hypothetical protein